MNHTQLRLLSLFILSLWYFTVAAQTTTNPAQVYLKSPEVNAGGVTTFRCHAPNAKTVLLIMDDGKSRPMQKDSTGTWSFTETLTPDIYRYTFAVDGTVMPDPNNPMIKPLFKRALGQSLAHVPGPKTLSWELNDVPHGQLVQHFYKSGIVGDERDIRVYTPPGYNPARKEPYHVLYLFHGITDETSAWSTAGRENIILDNLIAQGKAKPMIIVNTLGYGAPEMLNPGTGAYTKEALQKNEELFVSSFLNEVIPMVEGLYNTKPDKKYRAVAGLSMGGGQSLDIGLNNPDLFTYVGGFSSAVILLNPDYNLAFPKLDASINKKLKLIWIAIGRDDFLIASNRMYKTWLESKQIKFSYKETEGVHSYNVWRRYLTDFSQLIFKD
jgi:enterochelin esterase-like enzyme